MDLPFNDIATVFGGALGGGGITVFFIKRFFRKLDERLDRFEDALIKLKVELAENRGKMETIWRDINSAKIRTGENRQKLEDEMEKVNAQFQKQWGILAKIASPRVSDAIEKALRGVGE